MDFDFDSMSLAELFAASDRIGDKYLTSEEIVERDRDLAEAQAELAEMIGHDCEQQ